VYTQDFNPISDSLGLTAIFAALPLLTLFVLLGGLLILILVMCVLVYLQSTAVLDWTVV
jgi:hypothetical protein